MNNELLIAIGTGIGTILGTAIAQWQIQRYQSRKTDTNTQRAVQEIKRHTTNELSKSMGVPWAFIENLPLPAWCKDVNGTMRWINTEYEQEWGIKSSMYEGRTDFDMWPHDIAATFKRHDQLVIAQRQTLLLIETVPTRIGDHSSPREKWRIWKFPIFDGNGEVIGVGGIASKATVVATCNTSQDLTDTQRIEELVKVRLDVEGHNGS